MKLQAIRAIRDATLESVTRFIDLDQNHSADNDDGYHANGSAHHLALAGANIGSR